MPEVTSRTPPYARIAAELADRIAAGELRPGDRVSSTREITRTWGVAMATATKALASLRDPIELADREGLGALSMRRIATELDLATGISQEQWLTQQDATFNEILRQHPLPVLTRVTADPAAQDGLFEFGLARLLDGFATLLPPA